MKRSSLLWPALVLTFSAHTALAQSTPSQAPPKLEKIEEVADDGVTISSKQQSENKITERRDNNGNVVEATVKSGPSTYTVKPNHPVGASLPGDMTSGNQRGPMWTVLEFDLGKKKKKTPEEEAAPDTNVPPPPTVK